jgi:hypothetical protein
MYRNPDVTPAVRKRQAVEARIVKATVRTLLAAGFKLSVDDGGDELAITDSTNYSAIIDALMNTDEDYLLIREESVQPKRLIGWVRFVYGNDGWDVIADYSITLESYIGEGTKVQKLVDKYIE